MFNKFMRALRRGHKDERGITGLETAIILIAFVTVAAVFGYAVLSAGIFSAEKGKEVVYLGLEEAKSTMELKGACIAQGVDATGTTTDNCTKVCSIKFTVSNAVAGEPIDLSDKSTGNTNRCILSYVDQNQYHNNLRWKRSWVGYNDGDKLLETGEKAEITLYLVEASQIADAGDADYANSGITALTANTQFTIEFKPPMGAVVTVERTIPPDIDKIMDLH